MTGVTGGSFRQSELKFLDIEKAIVGDRAEVSPIVGAAHNSQRERVFDDPRFTACVDLTDQFSQERGSLRAWRSRFEFGDDASEVFGDPVHFDSPTVFVGGVVVLVDYMHRPCQVFVYACAVVHSLLK